MNNSISFAPYFDNNNTEMAVTRLKRKAKRNKARAKVRLAEIQRLNKVPTLKNVDVEAIKEEFAKNPKKATAKKEEVKEEKAEAPKAEKKAPAKAKKEEAPKAEKKAPAKKKAAPKKKED